MALQPVLDEVDAVVAAVRAVAEQHIRVSLSVEERRDFMKGIAECDAAGAIEAVNEMMEKYEDHYEMYEDSGSYLPLGVWKQKGFDPVMIEQNSAKEDIRDCRVVGKVYRVPILTKGRGGVKGARRSSRSKFDAPAPQRQRLSPPAAIGGSSNSAAAFGGSVGITQRVQKGVV